jgi:glycosyltransferase involved in cell wall biosynthesis
MHLIAVTRTRNEADIIEAFVRHHLALFDRLIFLDNGSTDRTVEILQSLKTEGLPITLFQWNTLTFVETVQNTFLFRQAAALGADWVACLDCDEFLDIRGISLPLREHLAGLPPKVGCLQVQLVNYQPTAMDNADLVIPLRITYRSAPAGVWKVIVRGVLARLGASVAAGNHSVNLSGNEAPTLRDSGLLLAHYFMRSGWQMLAKAVVGRLKVLASGAQEERRNASDHYNEIFHHLGHHPEWLLNDQDFMESRRMPEDISDGVTLDPIAYLGGPLRFTEPGDPRLYAARSIVASCEILARSHGQLLDAVPGVRDVAERGGELPRQLF